MMKHFKRAAGIALVSVLATGMLTMLPAGVSAAGGLGTYEAETLEGAELWTSIYETELPGYSGEGFAYLTNKEISIEVDAPEESMYDITMRCVQILSPEGRMQTISINGIDYTYNLPYIDEWEEVSFGVFRLKEGVNTITIKPQYGYAAYDTITIKEAELPELKGTAVPCDPDATNETKSLMRYLNSIYGKNVLSGQQEIYGGGHGVNTTIRYDKDKDICVDDKGNTYTFSEDSKGIADDGSAFVWTCYGEDGQAYNYDTQNRGYKYNEYDREIKYLRELTGDAPAVRGFDFGSNCPCYYWDDGVTGRMIDWAKKDNGICTASWHINVPTVLADYTLGEPLDFSKTTYSEKTDFKTANVLVEGTIEYDYFRLCMDNLAKQLLELQDAGVPVLFRPFHEAEGNGGVDGSGAWFWWSKEGTVVYKQLWQYLYKTLTEDYGIHNLIWEQNLYAWSQESGEWYVGDAYVDIVGFDKYDTVYNRHDGKTSGPNEDANSKVFWSLVDFVGNNKMVAMPENSTIPSVPNMTIEHANWLYFCTWYDEESSPKFISGEDYNDAATVKATYQSDYCITLSELPADLYSFNGDSPKPTEPATEPDTTVGKCGDVNCDGEISMLDVVTLNKSFMIGTPLTEQGRENALTIVGATEPSEKDSLNILKYVVEILKELPVKQ